MNSKQNQFQRKRERYLQPSLLFGLYLSPSYGYELIQKIQRYGFMEEKVPPGMIYRHLRRLEEDGLVASEWETTGAGPAKRIYQITSDGKEVLRVWVGYMREQARKLNAFVNRYNKITK